MKRYFYSIVSLLLVIVLFTSSCEKDPLKGPEYKRVVVLYMAANNNLKSFAEQNLVSLKEGYIPGKSSKDILLVYLHLKGNDPKLMRLFKEKDGVVVEDIVAPYTHENSANSDVLKAVLNKVKVIFPAKEYGLILWSHATGWLPEGYYDATPIYAQHVYIEDPYKDLVKSFGKDDGGGEIEVKDLKYALPYKFSFIIFDCCLMGGIETIYELRDKADYLIASPTEIMAYGFPYKELMSSLFLQKLDLTKTCQLYFDHYNNQDGIYKSATISIYKTQYLEELSNLTKTIFNNHREKIWTLDMKDVQPYFRLNKRWFWDLGDLISLIATPTENDAFNVLLNKVVINKWSTPYFLDLEIKRYSGISTYIQNPQNSYLDIFYKEYDWNIKSEMIK